MKEIILTDHGEMRVRKRAGLPKKAADKLVIKAKKQGLFRQKFSGSFRRYLDGLFLKDGKTPEIRVCDGYIFLFKGNTFITMWLAPSRYRKQARVHE